MRKYGTYLLIALLAFSLGFFARGFFRRARPSSSVTEPATVTLCELERNPDQYHGRLVRVKAVLYADVGGPYLYDWSCGSQNIYTYPLIDLRAFDGLTPELKEWVKNIGRLGASGEGLEADVIVTGVFDRKYSTPGDDAFAHRFRIVPTGVEQLSALHRRTAA